MGRFGRLHGAAGRLAAFGCALAISACDGPVGPIVGDWRGQDSAQSVDERLEIEVILDGLPGAQSGTYHYLSLTQTALTDVGNRRLDWAGQWQMRTVVANGQTLQLIHLDKLVGPRLGDYVLTSNDVLVPQYNLRRIDLSADALRVSLYPVPRGTFGYGRP